MRRRREHDAAIAQAAAASAQRFGGIELERVEVAVPRAFDEPRRAVLDAHAVTHAHRERRAGAARTNSTAGVARPVRTRTS
jgi:hypothetical protein